MNYRDQYNEWMAQGKKDGKIIREPTYVRDEKEIEDRFYTDLAFGTAGMRGKMGYGTNRMNEYVVARATQGLAQYLLKADPKNAVKGVAIAYDSRINSALFARVSAQVLAANGIKAYLYDSLRPVPVLSFTVRYLGTAAGIEITASHNTKAYNGYKVYGPDGGQITEIWAEGVIEEIQKVPDYFNISRSALDDPLILSVPAEVDDAFAQAVENIARPNPNSDLKIIYTPLHGSGNVPVRRILRDLGYVNVQVVPLQEKPDGRFPTVLKPNPEEKAVFDLAIQMAERHGADIIIGTDPDCDRLGIVCRKNDGEYTVLTGNQTGALLVDYLLKTRDYGSNKTIIKTIVTSEMGRMAAAAHGADCVDVLTGFKYIGEKITQWQADSSRSFVMGYEESYGYLSGNYARDKDGVLAAALACEMAHHYKQQGMTLYEALEALYEKLGYFLEAQDAVALEGIEGKAQITKIMDAFRINYFDAFSDEKLAEIYDYLSGEKTDPETGEKTDLDLPKSNVVKFVFDRHSWYALRPSGTEPKLKIYYSVVGDSHSDAEQKLAELRDKVRANLPK